MAQARLGVAPPPPPTSHRMRHQCLCYSVASKVSLLLGVELQEHGRHPSVTPEAPEPGTWSTALERASWSLPWAPLREVVVLATGLRRAGLCPKAPGADGIFCGSNKQKGHRWVRRPVCHLLQTIFKARNVGQKAMCVSGCALRRGAGDGHKSLRVRQICGAQLTKLSGETPGRSAEPSTPASWPPRRRPRRCGRRGEPGCRAGAGCVRQREHVLLLFWGLNFFPFFPFSFILFHW